MQTADIWDAVVIVDIDGTLVCSSRSTVSPRVAAVVRALQQHNAVYLFSNSYNQKRSRAIAHALGVPYIPAPHKKPRAKILTYIPHRPHKRIVVIGDKYLTDGLFARFIGATYIRVARYRCPDDSLFDKANCLCDDVVYTVLRWIGVVPREKKRTDV